MRPVQRFHWDSAEYAEAFATLVRCAGERVYERQILREIYAAYPAASHIAVVATINRHGHPHLTPNWYRYDGKVLTFITRTDRLKYLNLQRDNHIAVCIYDPPVASNYVVISGTATCNDQDIWAEARRIIARYRAAGEVDDYVARWQTEPRVLITVTPEHIATRGPR